MPKADRRRILATSQGRGVNGLLMTRSASRRWKALLAIGFVAAAGLYLFLSGEAGYVRVHAKKQELAQLRQRIEILEIQNDSLKYQLWQLDNDIDYIEKVAREEFGMARPGEHVYRIVRSDDAVKEPVEIPVEP